MSASRTPIAPTAAVVQSDSRLSAAEVAEIRRLDVAHHLPGQTDYQLHERMGGNRVITRAQGSCIYDAEGQEILDGMAGLWCVAVGYGREELAGVAHDQMVKLSYYNTFFKTTNEPAVRLATALTERLGGKLQHIFFNSSGSEAIDTAIRTVRHYWTVKGQPQRQLIISRQNAYHGSTVAGTSLGGMRAMQAQGGPLVPGIEHIMQPYSFNEGFGEDPAKFAERAAAALEERILKVGANNVAAFVGEPVQGAGGVIIPPADYWKRIEAICRKYGILLISDEVICGFGRLGRWFGFQHFGVQPDIVTMAKGISSGYIPLSATAISSDIIGTLRHAGGEFIHGYTYSGHPVATAVGLRNLEIMTREKLVERTAEDTGPYLARALERLRSHRMVGEARSLGLIGAVEIVSKPGTNERFTGKEGNVGHIVRDICIRRGLMVRAIRDSLVMCPPLVISHAQIDRLVETIAASLDEAEPVLRALPAAA